MSAKEYTKLDDKFIASIDGPEPGKSVMRLRDKLADGLFLRVTKHVNAKGAEQVSKSWEFYFTMNGKTSCTGLGRWTEPPRAGEPKFQKGLSVKEARRRAIELREMVEAGQNPVEVNAAKKAAPDAPKIVTFADALDEYMKSGKIEDFRSDKHRKQWRASLDLHAVPKIGAKDVGTLTIDDVKDVLKPIWATKTDTARRVRGRMESVFAWAMDEGCRQHDNPASVKALEVWIGNQKKAEAQNHPAIQQGDLPTWFADLRQRDGMAARALELAVLCASRSGEVRGATWGEIDLAAKVLTIPAARMKMKKPHSVPLSEAAVALLKSLPNHDADHKNPKALVFPAPRGGVMSDMTISAVMKRMHEAKAKKDGKGWIDPHVLTQPEDPAEEPQPRPAVPHGLRSTFKDWATEAGIDNIQSEIALAHRVGNEVEQRYRRTDLVEQRRAMMTAWAGFCRGDAASTVVALRAGGSVMAKLPYGFDANPIYETRQPKDEAEAWERLDEVQLSLEKGEAVAPELAAWLGEAIDHAKRDPTELLRRLGVERGRGKPKGDPNAWFTVGKRICNLEDNGMKPERAVATVAAELDEKYSRSQFQKFRDAYRAAWHVAHNPE